MTATCLAARTALDDQHIWRVADGMLVEHWGRRDDMGLLEQFRSS